VPKTVECFRTSPGERKPRSRAATRLTGWLTASRGGQAAGEPHGYSLIELLMVVAVSGVVAAIAVPMMSNLNHTRIEADARDLSHAVSQAKMVAAAKFTRARLFADLSTNGYHIEFWRKTPAPGAWVAENGDTFLSTATGTFGFTPVAAPPPNSQPAIAQAAPCLADDGTPIGNTACIVFNSRGVPVDAATLTPDGSGALYIRDDTAVYGVTVAATSAVRLWRANPVSGSAWVQK
jgi:prepilin-type N-terminal cleavage/methylation domain-containing protein